MAFKLLNLGSFLGKLPFGLAFLGAAVVSLLLLTGSSGRTDAQGGEPNERLTASWVPGELLVKFKTEVTEGNRLAIRNQLEAVSRHTFRSGAEHWLLGEGVTVAAAVASLREDDDVEYAEPNMIGHFLVEPDDPLFENQWALLNIEAPDAWNLTTGSGSVVIAVTDTGIEGGYPDLAPNMWSNSVELAGSASVDDDGNGYVDDLGGWDFVSQDNNPDPVQRSHGTSVAGIIGAHAAESGGFGMAGINWSVKIMNLRVGDLNLSLSALIEAVDYAVDNGAHIINMSIFSPCEEPPAGCSDALEDAIERARERDVLVVAGAGNDNVDIDDPGFDGGVPASYDLDNIIVVAGSDPNDRPAKNPPFTYTTSYGAVSVDLAAPGVNILTLADPCMGDSNCIPAEQEDPNTAYALFHGTSAATPHVAGVAGLIKALSPNIPYELMRQQVLDPNSLDPLTIDANSPFVSVTDGRLNAYKAVADHESTDPAQITGLAAGTTTKNSVQLNWTATADDGLDPNSGAASLYHVRYSTSTINSGNWLLAKKITGVPEPGDPNTADTVTVTGLTCNTTYYFALKAFDEWGNGPMSNVVSRTTSSQICTVSYCGGADYRCTWSGQCGPVNCCIYNCFYDETCLGPDTCPTGACSCY